MSKPVKIVLGILLIFVIIVVLAALLAVLFFPGDKIKAIAEQKATETLQVPVTIGKVGLSFGGIPSVKVTDVTVGEKTGETPPLFTLESAHVRINLLKLFKRQVEIVLIELTSPHVTVINRADGTSNLPPTKEKPEAAETAPDQSPPPPSIPLPVSLEALRIRNAAVTLDNSNVSGSVMTADNIELDMNFDISADMKAFSTEGKAEIGDVIMRDVRKNTALQGIGAVFEYAADGDITAGNVSLSKGDLTVNGLPVSVTAQVTGWTKTTFAVRMENMDIEKVLKATPEGIIPDRDKLTATGTFSLSVDGSADTSGEEAVLTYNGSLGADIGRLAFAGLPKSVDSAKADITFTEKNIDIRQGNAKIGGSVFSLSGTVKDYTGDPDVSIRTTGDISLDEVGDAVPMPEGADVGGRLDFDVTMNGKPSDLAGFEANGGANLAGVTAVMPEVFKNPVELNGRISLTPAAVKVENVRMESGKSDFEFAGRITNYMTLAGLGEEKALFTGTVQSKMVALDDLVVSNETTVKPWDLEEPIKNAPVPPKLAGDLSVFLNTVTFGKLTADSVKGRFTFQDGVYEMKGLTVNAYGGSLTGSSVFSVVNPDSTTYGGDFKLNAFDSAQFIADFLGAGDFVRGKLSSSLSFSGAGLDSVSMLNNLRANGNMAFDKGQFVNWDFAQKLGDHLKFMNFDTLDFQSIRNSFRVENQKFITPDMAVATSFGDVMVDGATGFDKKIDYTITLNLDKETSEKALNSLSGLTKYIEAKPDRLELTVNAGGSLTSPSFRLDTTAAEDVLKDALKDRAAEEVDKLLDSKDAEELKQKGKDLLKGIFKKD